MWVCLKMDLYLPIGRIFTEKILSKTREILVGGDPS